MPPNFGNKLHSSAFLRRCKVDNACLKSGAMPCGHRVGTHKIRTYPHQLPRYTLSSSSVAMWVVVFFSPICPSRGSLLLYDPIPAWFFSELCVTNKSIVNVRVSSFPALLLELICSVVFSITFFLSVPVTMWSALPDGKSSG